MENDIYRIDKFKIEDNQESKYIYYTIFGSHSDMDDSGNPIVFDKKEALAYSRDLNKQKVFYIKVGTYGKIFNPMGLYSEGRQNKFLSKVGKQEYSFKKVSQKAFDLYLSFLRTKNIAWLNNAERELK